MDDSRCRQYFLAPQETSQGRYQALRAVFVDGEPLDTRSPTAGS